jgi:hypothetical protein
VKDWIDIFDIILPPFYILIIVLVAFIIKNKKQLNGGNSHYNFLIPALLLKIFGGISLCLIYTFYYNIGGDVTNYYLSAKTYVNVLYDGNFDLFLEMLQFKKNNIHLTGLISKDYGQIQFRHNDYYALFTVIIMIPPVILGCKSFIASTIITASISFIGLWKLYKVFVAHFPHMAKQLAIAIFYIPSVFFWGSGLLKDTYCMFAIGIYSYSVYQFLILRNRSIKHLSILALSSFLLIMIKPYILFALLPGTLIWVNFSRIQNIKSPIIKTLSIPIIIIVFTSIIIVVFSVLDNYLGEYSMDNVLNKAVKTQKDLVREQYGNNFYDIGPFNASVSGIISKFPSALNMAMFRPFIWDARNPVMVLSGLENLFTLVFSIYIIIKLKLKTLFKSLFSHPLLVFSLLFSIFFAFSVGLTTANYGALVRLKIPFVPFYIASLFIIYDMNRNLTSYKKANV